MPTATNRDVALYYQTDGEEAGGEGEPVVFVGDVGLGAWQWSVQHDEITGPRRVVVWDLRGTGRSDAPPGPYTVDQLAGDLEAVLADAGVVRAHLVGAGLGGMVALGYAREYGRARSLALCCTAVSGDEVDESALRGLHPEERTDRTLRESLEGAFTDAFLTQHREFVDRVVEWRTDEDAGPDAIDAQIAAALGFDAGPLYEVGLPALVCNGVDDPVVSEATGRALAEGLPRAEYEGIAGRHLAFLESGAAVADRLVAFFEEVESDR